MAATTGYSSNAAWVAWTVTTATADTTTTNNCGAWREWTTCEMQTTATSNSTVWLKWTNGTTTNYQTVDYKPRQPTAEELEAERRRTEEYKRKAEEERKLRIAAEKRADDLLAEHLSEEQRREYRAKKRFHVIGQSGKRYRIRKNGCHINIDEMDHAADKVARRLCAYSPAGLPEPDVLLAQKLALECNEDHFVNRVANIHAA